jgi:HlyD family secretion protein
LNATRNENSANYTVVVDAKNAQGILPYLTAKVHFYLQSIPNVLLIPNAAFRWRPESSQTASELSVPEQVATSVGGDSNSSTSVAKSNSPDKVASQRSGRKTNQRLWIKDGDYSYHPVDVQVGASDGVWTEVHGNNIKEGMDVVLGENPTKDGGRSEMSGLDGGADQSCSVSNASL